MKKRINVLLCVLLACTLWGCKAQQPKQPEVKEEENHESVETQNLESVYDPDHIYGADEINPAVQSYSSFALKQLHACVNKGENDFVSSLSLYYVLAMLSNGAAGETRKELQTVLGLSTTDLNNFLKKLDDAYEN